MTSISDISDISVLTATVNIIIRKLLRRFLTCILNIF